jgi:hypothetical protein
MLDHSFFFAESVRLVLEAKSTWSMEEFEDVLTKCRSVRDIIPMYGSNLTDTLASFEQEIAALKMNSDHGGMIIVPHHIGTAAVFLKGGQTVDSALVSDELIGTVDDAWPDVMLLLEPGKVVFKEYEAIDGVRGRGELQFYNLGKDALLMFTAALLTLVNARSVQVHDPSFLYYYISDVADAEVENVVEFPLTRAVAQRIPLGPHNVDLEDGK